MSNKTDITVLTGDLLASTALDAPALDAAMQALSRCAGDLAGLQGEAAESALHFTRHRGDGWQVVLTQPRLGLRAALAFRAALRSRGATFDSHIALATGPVALPVGPDLNRESADVFVRSGQALERMKARQQGARMTYADAPQLQAATLLADHISQQWTPAQAEAMQPMLIRREPPSYTEVAQTLGKTRQVVTKALQSAGHGALLAALRSIEEAPDD